MSRGAVVIFARNPQLGQVKTRLAERIGVGAALALYQAFLRDTILSAQQSEAIVILAHTSGPPFPERELADIAYEQRGASFGERFDAALYDAKNKLPEDTPLVLIGADTPHLSPKSLRHALDVLENSDAVIGPSSNGGFYLLGFSAMPIPISRAFSYASDREVAEAVRILLRSGVKPKLLEYWFDIDLPIDLARLVSFLDIQVSIQGWMPPHTQSVLRERRIARSSDDFQSGKQMQPVLEGR